MSLFDDLDDPWINNSTTSSSSFSSSSSNSGRRPITIPLDTLQILCVFTAGSELSLNEEDQQKVHEALGVHVYPKGLKPLKSSLSSSSSSSDSTDVGTDSVFSRLTKNRYKNTWEQLDCELRACIGSIYSGSYVDILSSSASMIAALLGPITEAERLTYGSTIPSCFSASASASASVSGNGSLLPPHNNKNITTDTYLTLIRILRERIYRYINQYDNHDDDNYSHLDSFSSIDTPMYYATMLVQCVMISNLYIFIQGNYTGPDLPTTKDSKAWARDDDAPVVAQPGYADYYPPLLTSFFLSSSSSNSNTIVPSTNTDSHQGLSSILPLSSTPVSTSSTSNNSTATTDQNDDSIVDNTDIFMKPVAPIHRACLDTLRTDGYEAYELLNGPQYLLICRALTLALCPTTWADSVISLPHATVSVNNPSTTTVTDERITTLHRPFEDTNHSEHVYRGKKISKFTHNLYLANLLANRSAQIHQRSLVDREPSVTLWNECRIHMARVCSLTCPGISSIFSSQDTFQPHALKERIQTSKETTVFTTLNPELAMDARARIILEWGITQHFFDKPSAAKTSFLLSKHLIQLKLQLTGLLGRRTKYQQFDITQLVVKAKGRTSRTYRTNDTVITSSNEDNRNSTTNSVTNGTTMSTDGESLPPPISNVVLGGIQQIKLEAVDADTYLLENIKFTQPSSTPSTETTSSNVTSSGSISSSSSSSASSPSAVASSTSSEGTESDVKSIMLDDLTSEHVPDDGPLTSLDECVILALCIDIKNHGPNDGLTFEQMRPFVDRIVQHPSDWLVHSTGLLIKSWLEYENYRTAERAVLQLQALVDQHSNKLTVLQGKSEAIQENSVPAISRLYYLFALPWPSFWDLKRQCADRYRRLGAVRAALALYEDLQLWDDMITCCTHLDRVKRAEKLVRLRLQIAPTPYMYCMLGAVTDTDEPYHKAIELAGGKYPKAELAIGRRYFQQGEMDKALQILQKGLRGSPGSEKEWFLLGILGMRKQNFEIAIEGFSRVVQLDNTRSDAWSNLGSVFLHLQQWSKGFSALEQALKSDRKDWRVWSNFLIACIRTRNFSRAITVMHTLIDLYRQLGSGNDGSSGGDGIDVRCLGALVTTVIKSIKEERRIQSLQQQQQQQQQPNESDNGTTNDTTVPVSAVDNNDTTDQSFIPSIPVTLSLTHDDDDDITMDGDNPTNTSESLGTGSTTNDDDETSLSMERKYLDNTNIPAATHLSGTLKLLQHITENITRIPEVWELYAMLEEVQGKYNEGLECRLRQCRALQPSGWEKDIENISSLANATVQVVNGYLRTKKNQQGIEASRTFVNTLIYRIDTAEVGKNCSGYKELQELVQEINEFATKNNLQ